MLELADDRGDRPGGIVAAIVEDRDVRVAGGELGGQVVGDVGGSCDEPIEGSNRPTQVVHREFVAAAVESRWQLFSGSVDESRQIVSGRRARAALAPGGFYNEASPQDAGAVVGRVVEQDPFNVLHELGRAVTMESLRCGWPRTPGIGGSPGCRFVELDDTSGAGKFK